METMVGVETLLAQERWVRRLARALVGDDDEAEEVVQQTRLAWWRRAPDDPQRARSWLGTVVRNLAHNRRRDRATRRRIEGAPEPATEAPSTEQLVERLEVHRELAEAVSALEEPYRETVLLRYYEGLSAAEIARRLAVPAGTVRWRLKTGLDRLRVALDARHRGQRRTWMAALAPLADTGRSPGLPKVAFAGATALVLTGGLGAVVITRVNARPLGQVAWTEPAPPHLPRGRAGAGLAPQGAVPSPTGVAPAEAEPPAWVQLEGAPRRPVAGRVVSDGRPVAGARVRLSSGTLSWRRSLDRQAVTGADGRFAFPPQAPTNWVLTVTAPGREPAIVYLELRALSPRSAPGDQPIDRLEVTLGACRTIVEGAVRDAGGGVIVGATVRFSAPGPNGGTETSTDAAGRYRLCVGGAGNFRVLSAEASGYGTMERRSPDESGVVDFVLEAQGIVAARTVSADGSPVAGVDVVACLAAPGGPGAPPAPHGTGACRGGRSDEGGRFELNGLAPGSYRLTFATDEAARSGEDVVTVTAGQALRDREFRLSPVAVVHGVAFRERGPAAHAELTFAQGPMSRRTRADEHGRFRVRVLGGQETRISTLDPTGAAGRWIAALSPATFRAGQPPGASLRVELPPPAHSEPGELVTAPGRVAPAPAHPQHGRYGEQVQLLGYDATSDRVARGGELEVTVHYRVLAPLSGWRLFTHLVGPGFLNLDHAPAGGRHPVERWRAGEIIRDRFVIKVDAGLVPGRYRLMTGFWAGSRRLPVAPADRADGENRLAVLTLTVD